MRNFHSIRPLRLLLNSQNNLSYSDSILMKSCIFNLEFKSPSNSIFLHHFEGVNPLYFENYCYWWEGYGNLKCILISHLYFLSENFFLKTELIEVQFNRSVMSHIFQPHGLQHTRPPGPSPTPRACSNSCPLSRWYHPTIPSSVVPFSSGLQ